jgi:hypothetical protein
VTSLTATGRDYTAVATGFQPGEAVTVTLYSDPITLGTYLANSAGTVTVTWTMPTTVAAGSHRLVFAGAASGSVEKAFTVTSTGTLSGTGASALVPMMTLLGLTALALAGLALTMASRRRRT